MGIAPSDLEKKVTEGSEWHKAFKALHAFCCYENGPDISELLDDRVTWWQDTYMPLKRSHQRSQDLISWIEKNSLIYLEYLGK